jgi:VWFA-related protein
MASTPLKNRFLIFLFDDRHMTSAELPLVQKAALHLLERPQPETDYMAALSLMGINSGITRDRTALQSAIKKMTVHQVFLHAKEYCPDIDYYSADQIINKHNTDEFDIAVQKARQCSFIQLPPTADPSDPYVGMNNPNDPFQRAVMAAAANSLAVGEEDARESLVAIQNVVHAMAKLPGQRVLILVSSGFLTLSPETMAWKSKIMDVAAAADVVINAVDARGLYVGNLDASVGGTTSLRGVITGQLMQDHLASMQASVNAMSELALGTGGTFFHNNNDLQGGIETLTAVPENMYLLEVSLKDVKANGAFHRLQVKVDQPGLEVHARQGYFAPGGEAAKKHK